MEKKPIRVFMLNCIDKNYVYQAHSLSDAIQLVEEDEGVDVLSVREIPESMWDKISAVGYEDNDETTEPYYSTIRELMFENGTQQIMWFEKSNSEYKTIEQLIDEKDNFISSIPNTMGINLVAVDGIQYEKFPDGQLLSMTIMFLPSTMVNNKDVLQN